MRRSPHASSFTGFVASHFYYLSLSLSDVHLLCIACCWYSMYYVSFFAQIYIFHLLVLLRDGYAMEKGGNCFYQC